MPSTPCKVCGGLYSWRREEAFDKFGFGDGDSDSEIMTEDVVAVLEQAGYETLTLRTGSHNEIIESITLEGREQIPASVKIGHDDPRRYLPDAIVTLLDEQLPDESPIP